MYSSIFNPFRPFRSITFPWHWDPQPRHLLRKQHICSCISSQSATQICVFYPKFLYSGGKQTVTKLFFQVCSGFNRSLYDIPSHALSPSCRESICHSWNRSGATFLVRMVSSLCSISSVIYIFNREWERESRSRCTMNLYMLWHNDK